jgi:hypothetical protein
VLRQLALAPFHVAGDPLLVLSERLLMAGHAVLGREVLLVGEGGSGVTVPVVGDLLPAVAEVQLDAPGAGLRHLLKL